MHLLIPFAFASSEGCAPVLSTLQLPHLQKLLARLTPEALDAGDEFSLSPPHERALARAQGLAAPDGLIPWAAAEAAHNPALNRRGAWAFITPCHWQVGANHIAMSGQALPDFTAQESQSLLAAMKPYFEEDGIALHYVSPNHWLACSEVFRNLPTASLDRVVGRHVDSWMPRSPAAAPLRRLQNEMQMLLYTHPVNDAREARRVLPVNSFWLSGTGALNPQPPTSANSATTPPPALTVASTLREAALNDDWAAWATAWQGLDATDCAALLAALERGESVQLTLCGERHAQTFTAQPQALVKRFMNLFGTQPAATLLKQL
jgi:hypothetical protein